MNGIKKFSLNCRLVKSFDVARSGAELMNDTGGKWQWARRTESEDMMDMSWMVCPCYLKNLL